MRNGDRQTRQVLRRKANGNYEFIPGDIEMSITQQPDVLIEYVGGPIYVPPSADPNYVDVRA